MQLESFPLSMMTEEELYPRNYFCFLSKIVSLDTVDKYMGSGVGGGGGVGVRPKLFTVWVKKTLKLLFYVFAV